MAASGRLEFRVSPEDRSRIERAAQLAGEPVTAFARAAAAERADRILREYEVTTVVPAEFFDEILSSLDAPARPPAPALVAATARLQQIIVRD
ncbi:MAG: DUF1778 domain-containing protein [Actinomycetota bacterium]